MRRELCAERFCCPAAAPSRSWCAASRRGALAAIVLTMALGVVVNVGCGSSGVRKQVGAKYLREVSRAGLLAIYDAENEIVVAHDRLDVARDNLAAIGRRLAQAKRRLRAAEKRRSGVEVAEAWLKYLQGLEKWAEAEVSLLELGVAVSRATVELTKAQVIQREDLLGGKRFDVAEYQQQHDRLRESFDNKRKTVGELRKLARELEESWWKSRVTYVSRTGDYDSGLWID